MEEHNDNTANFARDQEPFQSESDYREPEIIRQYGDFTLENIIILTKYLGRLWGVGAQALALVRKDACFRCPNCNESVTTVCIGSLNFECEIEREWGNDVCVANLLAEHECACLGEGTPEGSR